MSARRLPRDRSLEHLKNQAKTLQRQARAGDPAAAALVLELHPQRPDPTQLKRTDAQLVLARSYGFASWAQLRDSIETVARYTRVPQGEAPGEPAADRLARLACLTYGGGDGDTRWVAAAELLAAEPELTRASIYAAAAIGDVEAARALLDESPDAARRPGGPHGWEPLLYACYSRVSIPGRSTLEVARLLLARDADPNAGYLWDGTYPFTALTGALGYGEDAPNQPPHEHDLELARLLLEAGADANDLQGLYNTRWRPGEEHLELLFAHGLGTGDGGTWARRLAPNHPTAQQLLEDELLYASAHARAARVALFLAHDVDPNGQGTRNPGFHGRSAYELARASGAATVAELLAEAGAETRALEPAEELLAACMASDKAQVAELLHDAPALARTLRERHPTAIARAAQLGQADAVQLLAGLGFDVNHKQRTTALHEAAWNGDRRMVDLLLSLGADPAIRDDEFNSTPSGWASHAHHEELAAYLATREG